MDAGETHRRSSQELTRQRSVGAALVNSSTDRRFAVAAALGGAALGCRSAMQAAPSRYNVCRIERRPNDNRACTKPSPGCINLALIWATRRLQAVEAQAEDPMRGMRIAAACLSAPLLAAGAQMSMMNTGGGRPSVSRDGKYIAYSAARNGEWEIYVMNADGTGERRLTNFHETNFVSLGPPTWLDGSILIWRRVGDTTRVSVIGLDAREQSTRVVVPYDAIQLRPSPDGRRLVFLHGGGRTPRLAVSNIDGTGLRELSDGRRPITNPDWSPDGSRLVFITVDSASHGQVGIVSADGTNDRLLSRLDPAGGIPFWPAWSPDGNRIAFQAGRYNRSKIDESTSTLWILDVANGTAARVAPHTSVWLDETPSWLPDAKHLAFQSNRTGVMQVWLMNLDGTVARQLTTWHP